MSKIRVLLHLLDTLARLAAFILVFIGFWVVLIGNAITGGILLVGGFIVGVAGFALGKKLKRKPRSE